MGLLPMMAVDIGDPSIICLSDRHSVGLTLHSTRAEEIFGIRSHIRIASSISVDASAKNSHYGFFASFKAGSVRGSQPSFALTSVNGKMNLHAFLKLALNHPMV